MRKWIFLVLLIAGLGVWYFVAVNDGGLYEEEATRGRELQKGPGAKNEKADENEPIKPSDKPATSPKPESHRVGLVADVPYETSSNREGYAQLHGALVHGSEMHASFPSNAIWFRAQ